MINNIPEHVSKESVMVTADDIVKAAETSPAEETIEEENEENEYYVEFKKPYKFDDDYYDGIDLSGLEDLSAADMIKTQREMERSGSINVLPEMSLEYACIFAARATSMPVEFFQNLPPREAIKVKNRVTNFFYGTD